MEKYEAHIPGSTPFEITRRNFNATLEQLLVADPRSSHFIVLYFTDVKVEDPFRPPGGKVFYPNGLCREFDENGLLWGYKGWHRRKGENSGICIIQ